MPELPDISAYIRALEYRAIGKPIEAIHVRAPFLVRTADPPVSEAVGRRVNELRRLGKRIVFALEGDLFLVLHLMISGRLHWKRRGAKAVGKIGLAAFDFPDGTLILTEASTKKRASLHLLRGERALEAMDRGGVEPLEAGVEAFTEALRRENHTLKRSLTDPRLFSGIGNAYSDEILHRAKLSPGKLTAKLTDDEAAILFNATRKVLNEWIERLSEGVETTFPENVTAFRPEMAVHGKFGKPCPVCGSLVQRITYADNELNYCATCQTGGKLLADRAMSRLLKSDWPRTLEALEEHMAARTFRPKDEN